MAKRVAKKGLVPRNQVTIKKASKGYSVRASEMMKSAKVAVSDAVAASVMEYARYPNAKLMVVYGRKGKGKSSLLGKITVRDGAKGQLTIETIPAAKSADIPADAFAPDAKARALLNGVERAQQDLAKSGGSFALEDVLKLLGVTRQQVHNKVQAGELFSVKAPGGRIRFPVVQFSEDGPVAGLKDVVEAFPSKNSWMLLNFLVHPDAHLGDRKPIDLLKKGETDLVVTAARLIGMQGA